MHRKTKSREADSDIRPLIREARWQEDGSFFLRLSAGSAQNLKPEAVLDGFFHYLKAAGALPAGLLPEEEPAESGLSQGAALSQKASASWEAALPRLLRIHRLDLYGLREGKLVSLEDFGEDLP